MQSPVRRTLFTLLIPSLLTASVVPPARALERETKVSIAGGVGAAAFIGFLIAAYHAGKYTRRLSKLEEQAPPVDEPDVKVVREYEEQRRTETRKHGVSIAAAYALILTMFGSITYLQQAPEDEDGRPPRAQQRPRGRAVGRREGIHTLSDIPVEEQSGGTRYLVIPMPTDEPESQPPVQRGEGKTLGRGLGKKKSEKEGREEFLKEIEKLSPEELSPAEKREAALAEKARLKKEKKRK